MDIKDIKVLIKIVTESDITDFEMESGGEKLVIRRGQAPVMVAAPAPQVVAAPLPAAAPSVLPAAAAAPAVAEAAPAGKGSADERYETVVSPIVGTFYGSPSPDSDPYVVVGTVLEKGQVMCIVEAMKLMNEIEAEFKCRVVQILKENATAVEFGDPLFLVEPL
jgi:acetyl-CoA carboxylase biotin carboxyl carrier protein